MKYWFRKFKSWFPASEPSVKSVRKFRAIPIKAGEIAIDCGANLGDYTATLAEAGGTVYAFEPNPHAYEKLVQRFRDQPQIHCLQKGVLDRNDSMKLFLHEHSKHDEVKWSTGSSLLESKPNVESEQYTYVDLVDLSEFVLQLNERVKVLKIDVEGVEYEILNRLMDTGAIHQIDRVFVETHEHSIPELKAKAKAVRSKMRKMGLSNIDLGWK